MTVYKVFRHLLMVPGIFILIFVLASAYCYFVRLLLARAKNVQSLNFVKALLSLGILFFITCGFFTYVISVKPGAYIIMHHLEYKYPRRNINPDAIVLLGESYGRTRTAINLYKEHKVDIISSGHMGSAEKMARIMRKEGVKEKHIILEKQATNTKDHVKYILPIAKAKGYKMVYLVTSAYHMPRSMMNFEEQFARYGIKVVPYACEYFTAIEYEKGPSDGLPEIKYYCQSAIAWHEYLGMLELIVLRYVT